MLLDMSYNYKHAFKIKEEIIIYELLIDMNILYEAFIKCKKGVDWKTSVQRYEANILVNLYKLQKSLMDGTYKVGKYVEFTINERGKTRCIKSPAFTDKILQRAICDYILEPTLYPYLIYDNGASIKGKGVEFSRERLNKHLQSYYRKYGNKGYILVCDFKKFFESVPHDKLIIALEKYITDEKVMMLLKKIIYSFNDEGKGLGIGSQVSQICGVYYPTPLDNYCKIVKQCKYYGRHMDDFYIVHNDKRFLQCLLTDIREIAIDLGLTLNEKKTQIYRIDKGFIFLKQYIFVTESGKIIRKPYKKNVVTERRKLKAFKVKLDNGKLDKSYIKNCYKSWKGSIEKYNSYHIIENMNKLYNQMFEEKR